MSTRIESNVVWNKNQFWTFLNYTSRAGKAELHTNNILKDRLL